MAKHTFVVFTEAKPGRDAEFNDWYDNRHVPDVLAVPGFIACQRFRLRPEDGAADAPTRYLALYEMETNDLEATMAELMSRAGTPAMPISDSMNAEAVRTIVADQLGARVLAPLTTA